jgi:hypothetical protein
LGEGEGHADGMKVTSQGHEQVPIVTVHIMKGEHTMTKLKASGKQSVLVTPAIRKVVYGQLPDIPDNRDHIYGAVRKIPKMLPAKADLRSLCSKVEDQKELGSCTANALAGALEFLMKKDKVPYVDLSRLFIYYNERVIEHTVRTDAGAMIRDGIKTLAKQGACAEKNWPYVIAKFAVKPPKACYTEALDRQILSYARLNKLDEMRACLADGYPLYLRLFRLRWVRVPESSQDRGSRHAQGERADAWRPCGVGSGIRRQGETDHRSQLLGDRLGKEGVLHHALRLCGGP